MEIILRDRNDRRYRVECINPELPDLLYSYTFEYFAGFRGWKPVLNLEIKDRLKALYQKHKPAFDAKNKELRRAFIV